MNLRYYPSLPEEYGEYYFQLTDGSKIWGLYSSFAYPHDPPQPQLAQQLSPRTGYISWTTGIVGDMQKTYWN